MSEINKLYPDRVGCITASSSACLLVKGKVDGFGAGAHTYAKRLAAERIGVVFDDYVSPAMQKGHDEEPIAIQVYENSRELKTEYAGFVLYPSLNYIGCTPDALVGEDGLLEVKCPGVNNHMKYILDGMIKDHNHQVQHQMMVTGRLWTDLMTFNRDVPDNVKAKVYRVERDEEYIDRLLSRCMEFEPLIEKYTNELLSL